MPDTSTTIPGSPVPFPTPSFHPAGPSQDSLSPTVPCVHDVLAPGLGQIPAPAVLRTLDTANANLDTNSFSPTLHANRVVPARAICRIPTGGRSSSPN